MSEILTSFTKKDHPYKIKRSHKWGNSIEFPEQKYFCCYICNTWYGKDVHTTGTPLPGLAIGKTISVIHFKKLGKVSYILPRFHYKCAEMFNLCPPVK